MSSRRCVLRPSVIWMIKRKIYTTREHARADIFDYIEMFYNSRRKHGEANNKPPLAYEKLEEFKRKSV